MLRILMLSILLLSCNPKVYQEPIATFQGKVVIFDPDPLCRVKQGKRSNEMLEDILRNKMWVREVKIPYKQPLKSFTSIKCEY